MGTAIKHPVPNRVKPSFVIFDIQALLTNYLPMVYEETAHAALDNSACTTVMHSYVQQAAAASCDEDKLVKMKANAEAVQSGQNIDKEINLCGGHQYIVTTLLCNVFVKYNAALPSAVAAERLFRVAGQILVPQCCIQ